MLSARHIGQILALLATLALLSLVAAAYSTRDGNETMSEKFAAASELYAAGDYEASGKALLTLARSGDANAQALLAAQYLEGLGLDQDDADAAIWFYRSARRGHAAAQLAYGQLLAEGRGISRNDAEAYRWLLLAASRDRGPTAERARKLAQRLESVLDQEDCERIKASIASWRPTSSVN